jgi:hypothetical protein
VNHELDSAKYRRTKSHSLIRAKTSTVVGRNLIDPDARYTHPLIGRSLHLRGNAEASRADDDRRTSPSAAH